MPYREAASGACRRHALTPASATCVACAAPVCDGCTAYDGAAARCAGCARSFRRARARRAAIVRRACFAAAALAALVVILLVRANRARDRLCYDGRCYEDPRALVDAWSSDHRAPSDSYEPPREPPSPPPIIWRYTCWYRDICGIEEVPGGWFDYW